MQSRQLQQLGIRNEARVVGHRVDRLRDLAIHVEAVLTFNTYYAVVEVGFQLAYSVCINKHGLLGEDVVELVRRQRQVILVAVDVDRCLGQALRKHLGGDLVLGPLDPIEDVIGVLPAVDCLLKKYVILWDFS